MWWSHANSIYKIYSLIKKNNSETRYLQKAERKQRIYPHMIADSSSYQVGPWINDFFPSPTLPPTPTFPTPPQQTFPEMLVLPFCHQLIRGWKLCGIYLHLCVSTVALEIAKFKIPHIHMRICQQIWILGAVQASETDEGEVNMRPFLMSFCSSLFIDDLISSCTKDLQSSYCWGPLLCRLCSCGGPESEKISRISHYSY